MQGEFGGVSHGALRTTGDGPSTTEIGEPHIFGPFIKTTAGVFDAAIGSTAMSVMVNNPRHRALLRVALKKVLGSTEKHRCYLVVNRKTRRFILHIDPISGKSPDQVNTPKRIDSHLTKLSLTSLGELFDPVLGTPMEVGKQLKELFSIHGKAQEGGPADAPFLNLEMKTGAGRATTVDAKLSLKATAFRSLVKAAGFSGGRVNSEEIQDQVEDEDTSGDLVTPPDNSPQLIGDPGLPKPVDPARHEEWMEQMDTWMTNNGLHLSDLETYKRDNILPNDLEHYLKKINDDFDGDSLAELNEQEFDLERNELVDLQPALLFAGIDSIQEMIESLRTKEAGARHEELRKALGEDVRWLNETISGSPIPLEMRVAFDSECWQVANAESLEGQAPPELIAQEVEKPWDISGLFRAAAGGLWGILEPFVKIPFGAAILAGQGISRSMVVSLPNLFDESLTPEEILELTKEIPNKHLIYESVSQIDTYGHNTPERAVALAKWGLQKAPDFGTQIKSVQWGDLVENKVDFQAVLFVPVEEAKTKRAEFDKRLGSPLNLVMSIRGSDNYQFFQAGGDAMVDLASTFGATAWAEVERPVLEVCRRALEKYREDFPMIKMDIVGHSLGGAMGQWLAGSLPPQDIGSVVCFGAPGIGKEAAAGNQRNRKLDGKVTIKLSEPLQSENMWFKMMKNSWTREKKREYSDRQRPFVYHGTVESTDIPHISATEGEPKDGFNFTNITTVIFGEIVVLGSSETKIVWNQLYNPGPTNPLFEPVFDVTMFADKDDILDVVGGQHMLAKTYTIETDDPGVDGLANKHEYNLGSQVLELRRDKAPGTYHLVDSRIEAGKTPEAVTAIITRFAPRSLSPGYSPEELEIWMREMDTWMKTHELFLPDLETYEGELQPSFKKYKTQIISDSILPPLPGDGEDLKPWMAEMDEWMKTKGLRLADLETYDGDLSPIFIQYMEQIKITLRGDHMFDLVKDENGESLGLSEIIEIRGKSRKEFEEYGSKALEVARESLFRARGVSMFVDEYDEVWGEIREKMRDRTQYPLSKLLNYISLRTRSLQESSLQLGDATLGDRLKADVRAVFAIVERGNYARLFSLCTLKVKQKQEKTGRTFTVAEVIRQAEEVYKRFVKQSQQITDTSKVLLRKALKVSLTLKALGEDPDALMELFDIGVADSIPVDFSAGKSMYRFEFPSLCIGGEADSVPGGADFEVLTASIEAQRMYIATADSDLALLTLRINRLTIRMERPEEQQHEDIGNIRQYWELLKAFKEEISTKKTAKLEQITVLTTRAYSLR